MHRTRNHFLQKILSALPRQRGHLTCYLNKCHPGAPLTHHECRNSGRFFQVGLGSLALGLIITAMATAGIQAQTISPSFQLALTPATAYIKLKPGTTVNHSIILKNPTNFAITVTASVVDFIPDGKTGSPQLQTQLTCPYLSNASTLAEPITIPAQQQGALSIALSAPADAPERECPMTILVHTQQPTAESAATALMPTIGSNLVVWVSERDQPDQQLEVVSLQRPTVIDSFRPLDFEPLVQNLEIMSAVASGSATVKNWRGEVLGTMDIYPAVILGQSTRTIQGAKPSDLVLPTDPSAAFATALQPTPFKFTNPFWFGPYTVEFSLITPTASGQVTKVQVLHIIALPISLFVIATTIGVILAGGWWWQRKQKSND